jgi:hypothetical protein
MGISRELWNWNSGADTKLCFSGRRLPNLLNHDVTTARLLSYTAVDDGVRTRSLRPHVQRCNSVECMPHEPSDA